MQLFILYKAIILSHKNLQGHLVQHFNYTNEETEAGEKNERIFA